MTFFLYFAMAVFMLEMLKSSETLKSSLTSSIKMVNKADDFDV